MTAREFLADPSVWSWLEYKLKTIAPGAFEEWPLANPKPIGPQGTLGVIAGGAPANLLISLWTGKPAPVNDVDLFHSGDIDCRKFIGKNSGENPTLGSGVGVETSDYPDLNEVCFERGYTIEGEFRDGPVNHVLVQALGFDETAAVATEHILEGFDINVTMVAWDVATKKLIWLPAFEEALTKSQIEVVSIATPWRTAFRIAAKAKELPLHCNVGREISILSQPYVLALEMMKTLSNGAITDANELPKSRYAKIPEELLPPKKHGEKQEDTTVVEQPYHDLQWRLGAAHSPKLLKNKDILLQHLELFETLGDENAGDTHYGEIRVEPLSPEAITETRSLGFNIYTHEENVVPRKFTFRPKDLTLLSAFVPFQKAQAFCRRVDREDSIPSISVFNACTKLVRMKKTIHRKAEILCSRYFTTVLFAANPETANSDFTEEHVKEFDIYLQNHHRLADEFVKAATAGGTFRTIFEAMKVLKTCKRAGFIGRLETLIGEENLTVEILKGSDAWKDAIAAFELEKSVKLVEPVNLTNLDSFISREVAKRAQGTNTGLPSTWAVRELIDGLSLENEGAEMHHCVGGYGLKVQKGECRIFHITTDAGESTCEFTNSDTQNAFWEQMDPAILRPGPTRDMAVKYHHEKKLKPLTWRISQNRAHSNGNPPPENHLVAQAILEYLKSLPPEAFQLIPAPKTPLPTEDLPFAEQEQLVAV